MVKRIDIAVSAQIRAVAANHRGMVISPYGAMSVVCGRGRMKMKNYQLLGLTPFS